MENRMVLNRARQAGRVAYRTGRTVTDNPFNRDTPAHREWVLGYKEQKSLLEAGARKARRQRQAAAKKAGEGQKRRPAAKKASKKAAKAAAPAQVEGARAPAPPAGESQHRAGVGDEA